MHERRFRRIPFEAQAVVSVDGNEYSCELLDLAMKGALLASDKPLSVGHGQTCLLCITLQGGPISLNFEAELVHQDDDHYGFKFLSEDLATLTHLRKLIELNTGDAETTRNELFSWLDRRVE